MPADFDKCVSGGGRVRTVKPNGKTYLHVCFDKSGSHKGEVKHTAGAWNPETDPPGDPKACDFYEGLETGTRDDMDESE